MSLIQQNYQNFLNIKKTLPALKSFCNYNISRNFYQLNHDQFTLSRTSNNLLNNKNNLNDNKDLLCFKSHFKGQQQRLYITHSGKRCWKCKAVNKIEAVFCEKCHSVQILDPEIDYFSVLGIKKEFDIDLKSLKVKFLKLQQSVHPDNFSTKSDKEKQYSDQQSSYINKAYHTLIQPLERSLYLLDISGHGVTENDNVKDMQFLMDIMSINEGIDDAESQDDIDDISDENNERINESINKISNYFKSSNWDAAKDETIKLRYWTNIQNTLKEWTPKTPKK